MLPKNLYFSTALVLLLTSQSALAKPENAYGPVFSGQTLWDIAAEVRPDNSVSITQLTYSLFDLNPTAFESGNMNMLKKGAYLEMPDKAKVLSMTRQQAQVIFKQHGKALNALRASAGSLNKAKAKQSKYRKQVKQLQKKLAKLRHESGAWNKTYKQLLKSKNLQKKWNKEVTNLRESLLAKTIDTEPPEPTVDNPSPSSPSKETLATLESNLKDTSPAVKSDLASMNMRIEKLQSTVRKLITLQKAESSSRKTEFKALQEKLVLSNTSLEAKVKSQATMEQRFSLLENELGKKERIILKLRSTLRVAATAMKKQQVENKALQKQLQALDPNSQLVNVKPRLELQVTDSVNDANTSAVSAKSESVVSEQDSAKAAVAATLPVAAMAKPVLAKPIAVKILPTNETTVIKSNTEKQLSRDEKRRLRMAKANQGNQSYLSVTYWKNLVTQNLIPISAVLGTLVLLIISYLVIGGRRKKSLKAKALAEKHNDLFVEASKLSDINTGDDNVSQIDLRKAG